MNDELLIKIKKNDSEQIWFTRSVFKGKVLYHIRTYLVSRMNWDVKWLPTKKGVTFGSDQLPEFLMGVDKFRRSLASDIIRSKKGNEREN